MLRELATLDDDSAGTLLLASGGALKPALVAALAGVEPARAAVLLDRAGGQVRAAVALATAGAGAP